MPVVQGFQNLFSSLLTGLLVLIPIACACMIAFHSAAKAASDGDAGVIAEKNRKIKNVLIAGAIGMCASSLIKWALAYFK
ncbi:MAG: hypothetical protein LKF87_12375 [Clostridium tyrobutyricum]|jgi:uncharacterized membrane protein|uniref:hypothetical protein n=1 Tax=Clostridium tyrobutyricum TaxID=1519 RepID=UPI00242B2C45|nr:hypothetical protein [Clostridium tyrobutyricum]MCH4200154.1 hypothetical protein [Clostridium tyrobutyricum]MCH4237912.1 hypothetical protein [Clostridium tyrobutyricum]MCH4259722.1 hypothetical protein [Clostridium tyrobutyricum]